MITIVLIIHVFIVIALVGVVLLQRSEGGALGIGGGGGGGGGFMSGRGAANALTRTTTILAGLFFATSLGLAIFGEKPVSAGDIARELTGDESTIPGAVEDGEVTSDDLLDSFVTPEAPSAASETDELLTLPTEPDLSSEDESEEPDSEDDTTPQ